MALEDERLEILRMVERGDITPEEGMRLIRAISGGQRDGQPAPGRAAVESAISEKMADEESVDDEVDTPDTEEDALEDAEEGVEEDAEDTMEEDIEDETEVTRPVKEPLVIPAQVVAEETPTETDQRFARWKSWWMLPMSIGAVITVISAFWMYQGYHNRPFGWGFWLSWIPFLIGVGLMTLAAMSSTARWLHVRVKQKPGKKPAVIAISFPLPFGLIKLGVRLFGNRIPKVKGQNVAEMVDLLDKNLSNDAPFYVHVDDEDGEQVEVFIG